LILSLFWFYWQLIFITLIDFISFCWFIDDIFSDIVFFISIAFILKPTLF
jgi:hypothetical protein